MKLPYTIIVKYKFRYQKTQDGKKWIVISIPLGNGKKAIRYDHVPKDSNKFEVAKQLYGLYLTAPNQP